MITNLVTRGDIGFMSTNRQFVLIIKGDIIGPFNNKSYKKIIEQLKQEDK